MLRGGSFQGVLGGVGAVALLPGGGSECRLGVDGRGRRPPGLARKASLGRGGSGDGLGSRARSAAALVLQRTATPLPVAVRVNVATAFDVRVAMDVPTAQVEGEPLPEVCIAGSALATTFVSSLEARGAETRGTLQVEGFEGVSFSIAHDRRGQTFVGAPGRWRFTVLSAPGHRWREATAERPTEGRAADLELAAATVSVKVRAATASELKRCLQLQALRDAEKEGDYTTLHAQVTKAKAAGVDFEHIERGEERLRALRKLGLHVAAGCDKETLQGQMAWSKVTRRLSSPDTTDPCSVSEDCPCNEVQNPGERFEVERDAVQACLGSGSDKELFEELVESALVVEEGCVWKAGGKFIFSAFNRNQSATALTRMLSSRGRQRCADMLLALIKMSEEKYGGFVTAVQINFHSNGSTFHDQHRDIYSAKQRAGPNCTCSFRECVGTVCYSMGSSRVCLCETMVDEQSAIRPCCECCGGRTERRWLHSGDSMFFNATWNQNHTHGIPQMLEDEVGPRISVAFLLGADAVCMRA